MKSIHDGITKQCRVVCVDRVRFGNNPLFPLVVVVCLATIFKYDYGVTGFGFYNAFALVASLGFKTCDCDAFDSMSWPVDYERPTGILHGGVYFVR